ncbi:hypothetical protein EK904_001506 [Melospiza melodia maxima]|nr:hypothetical protein EK904_001506 [Melospiza melodia maxima]
MTFFPKDIIPGSVNRIHLAPLIWLKQIIPILELNQVIIPTYGTVPDQQNLHTPEWFPEADREK